MRFLDKNTFLRSNPRVITAVCIAAFTLFGCVQDSSTYLTNRPIGTSPPIQTPSPSPLTQTQTIGLEASDRIARFRRLAEQMGTDPPDIEELTAPAGTVPGVNVPVPVVRVVFKEKVFFDTNQAIPRPESKSVIATVAENMRRDVPDAALTLLGHTDSIGSDEFNIALSKRRASTVLSELIQQGVNPNQLSTVAIGRAQPIATNATEQGRARNRRVEFMISGSEAANLSVVRDRPVNTAYMITAPGQVAPLMPASSVQVLKPTRPPSRQDDEGILGPTGILTLRAPSPDSLPATPAAMPTTPRNIEPSPVITPREPEPVLPAPLGERTPLNF